MTASLILFYSILSAIFQRLSLMCVQRIFLPFFRLQHALKIMAIPALELPGTEASSSTGMTTQAMDNLPES
ncbi:hypothetical protein L2E82_32894 [Cichorium intybus]|uniref:Uncharacterized protein n=1 Tax=Cichorium intybus TaxID=13427 RepID=A0ACB9BII9_CICIN|nr:hypothetical protein L2E82_32894 [Cichorium intybus]